MNLTSFLQDKHLTVALRGEIDHHSAKDIMRVLGNKIDLYLPRVCVLDFREVTFMDSSGIAIVISCVRRMRQRRNGRLGKWSKVFQMLCAGANVRLHRRH